MAINNVIPNINVSRYVGEWIVICENKLIAHDKDINKLDRVIKNCKKVPTIAKIPKKETLIF